MVRRLSLILRRWPSAATVACLATIVQVAQAAPAASASATATATAAPASGCPSFAQLQATLRANPSVVHLVWSGSLPQAHEAFGNFVRDRGQSSLGEAARRLQDGWRQRLGFDPLDAAALRAAGLVPKAGVTFVQVAGQATPLVVACVGDAAAWQRHRLACLREQEGDGAVQAVRTPNARPYRSYRRRFGTALRAAGAEADVAAGAVAVAVAGGEPALVALLDGAATAPAGNAPPLPALSVGAPLPLGDAPALWRRAGGGVGELHAQLQFTAQEVLASVDWAGGDRPRPPASPGPALAAEAASGLLLEASVQDLRPFWRQLDADRARALWQRAGALAGAQTNAAGAAAQLRQLTAQLQAPALAPLRRLLDDVPAAAWLRLYTSTSTSAGAAPAEAVRPVLALRVDDARATAKLSELVRRRCAAKASAGDLACLSSQTTPWGRGQRLQLAPRHPGERPIVLLWTGPWLLIAQTQADLDRLAARLPPSGDRTAAVAAATPSAALAPLDAWPVALAQAAVLPQASGELSFATLADVITAVLVPQAAGLGASSLLPKLLLAGPMGDALRELAALGRLQWRLRQDESAIHLGLRLQAAP